MQLTFLRHASLWATLPFSNAACAAASLLVDDAGTTPAGHCQLESWARRHGNHPIVTTTPACTLGGTEWSLGLSHLPGAGSTPWSLGSKRTLRGLDDERVQFAFSAGIGGDMRHAGARGWTLNLPASFVLDVAGRIVLHANVGWDHDRVDRGMTAGIGSAIGFASGWSLLAERWRDAARVHGSQIGVRRHLRDEASLDLLAGHAHDASSTSWITVGLNIPLAR